MTWIRLNKSLIQNGKKFPMGRLLNKATPEARRLVEEGSAEFYEGPKPPIQKMKTDLFKPKN